jgi:hypothetical protein
LLLTSKEVNRNPESNTHLVLIPRHAVLLQELLSRIVEVLGLCFKHASSHNLLCIDIRPDVQPDLIAIQRRQSRMQRVHPALPILIKIHPKERTTLHILRRE